MLLKPDHITRQRSFVLRRRGGRIQINSRDSNEIQNGVYFMSGHEIAHFLSLRSSSSWSGRLTRIWLALSKFKHDRIKALGS